jgi:two-component system, LuxR family, response regulator FixJ
MGQFGRRVIYVVDDDHMIRQSLDFFLSTAGYHPRQFSSGIDFLGAVPKLPPGCVVLDIRMPDMDGLQVMREMADMLDRYPVIVMTGHGDIATAVTAMQLGAFDFLEKPYEEAVLIQAIEGAFDRLDRDKTALEERSRSRAAIESLTLRERDVLNGLAAGHPNKVIAEMLGLSVRTVEMHRASMMHRLGIRTLGDALRIYHLAHRLEADGQLVEPPKRRRSTRADRTDRADRTAGKAL